MSYRLGEQFVLRMTGFPVESVEALCSARLAAALDELLSLERELKQVGAALCGRAVAQSLGSKKQRRQLNHGAAVEGELGPALAGELAAYNAAQAAHAARRAALDALLDEETTLARRRLHEQIVWEDFRHVLLLSSPDLEAMTPGDTAALATAKHLHRRETSWLAYLQRLATKNETISFFGPAAWGRVDARADAAVELALAEPAVAERIAYVERWLCNGLAARMTADPDVLPHLRPAWADDLVLDTDGARLLDADERVALSADDRALLARCDGATPVAALDREHVLALVAKKVLRCEVTYALHWQPLDRLRDEVAAWPGGVARARWLERLERLEGLRARFAAEVGLEARRRILGELRRALAELDVAGARSSHALYAARLPLNEDCRRAVARARLGGAFVEQMTRDLAPFYELWRDLAGLYATRVHARLAGVFAELGSARVPLPTFMRAVRGLPMSGGGFAVPELDAEIQAAWAVQLGARAAAPEVALTEDDLSFVRRTFRFRRMRAFDLPAPDVQIGAPDGDAVAEGRFTVVLGEIHADLTPWQQALAGWCPDLPGLLREYLAAGHAPQVIRGREYEGWSPHNLYRVFLPGSGFSIAGPVRIDGIAARRAADAYVRCTDDDVAIVDADDRPLGSFVHSWETTWQTHRLELLGTGAHTPRLRVGRVVVQRRTWLLEPDDAVRGATGASGLVALERLRREHDLPAQVFVRPLLPVRGTLHKGAKPIFVDFRSPLLVDLLARALRDFRRLRVTEMLPTTQDCWLADSRGRYSFELRLTARPDVTPPGGTG